MNHSLQLDSNEWFILCPEKENKKVKETCKKNFSQRRMQRYEMSSLFQILFWDHPHMTFALGGGSQKADEGEGGYAYLDIHILLFQEGMILRGK